MSCLYNICRKSRPLGQFFFRLDQPEEACNCDATNCNSNITIGLSTAFNTFFYTVAYLKPDCICSQMIGLTAVSLLFGSQ